ncbi:hypothetical protein [Cryobacterium sp. Y11]|uniref:hypothetical protein n=1 Tax=Cryobacterium sp. Y11 TaxID=2045016 RepID=UPI0011AFEB6A|nr:hypothetical protein [Cryobacterium sp. Y11]
MSEAVTEIPACTTALAADAYADFETSGLALRDYQGWRTDIQFMADGGFVYRDGTLFYVSYPALTQWVPALADA